MKTLYEQLTDKQLKKIEDYRLEFPTLTERAELALKNNKFAFDVSISNALIIKDILIEGVFDVCKFHDIFNKN